MKKILLSFAISILISTLFACFFLQIKIDKLEAAFELGKGVMGIVYNYAQDYIPEAERVVNATYKAVKNNSIKLGPAIGDIMAIVQGISDHVQINKYAQMITMASAMLMNAVHLDWNIPEKYQEARSIFIAFLEGMRAAKGEVT